MELFKKSNSLFWGHSAEEMSVITSLTYDTKHYGIKNYMHFITAYNIFGCLQNKSKIYILQVYRF